MKTILPTILESRFMDELLNHQWINRCVNYDYVPEYASHNYSETDDIAKLTIDIPGFQKDDISIDYKKEILTVTATSNDSSSNRSNVKKQFRIPGIELKKSTADYTNGVLLLTLEKQTDSKKQTLKIS